MTIQENRPLSCLCWRVCTRTSSESPLPLNGAPTPLVLARPNVLGRAGWLFQRERTELIDCQFTSPNILVPHIGRLFQRQRLGSIACRVTRAGGFVVRHIGARTDDFVRRISFRLQFTRRINFGIDFRHQFTRRVYVRCVDLRCVYFWCIVFQINFRRIIFGH